MDWTLAQFANRLDEAQRRFREFVSEGRNTDYQPWVELRGRGCVGSGRFVESLAERVRKVGVRPELPRSQRLLARRPGIATLQCEVRRAFGATEADMAARSRHPARKAFALLARRVVDARLADIAEPLGLSPRSASSLLKAGEALEDKDSVFKGPEKPLGRKPCQDPERLFLRGFRT